MKLSEIRKLSFPAVSPSLLAADKKNIPAEVRHIEPFCHFVHIDIMDAIFVPNLSFYKEFPGTFATSLIKDTHLMVIDPLNWIEEARKGGSEIITFHLEAYEDPSLIEKTIKEIRRLGALAGLSIKPGTPLEKIRPYLDKIDLVLLMTVEPGLGGQSYLPGSNERIETLKEWLSEFPYEARPIIEIDGGVNETTGKIAIEKGAELLVAGSYLFGHEDLEKRIKGLIND